uniref:Uncharacterized protein n=1 Tax=Timema poppense TaxID=170557 RepID=A0A7R9DLI2_TIMPO|nr:unnamed protein product [Timema poppensis]
MTTAKNIHLVRHPTAPSSIKGGDCTPSTCRSIGLDNSSTSVGIFDVVTGSTSPYCLDELPDKSFKAIDICFIYADRSTESANSTTKVKKRVPGYRSRSLGLNPQRSGSGSESTQPREDKSRRYLNKEVAAPV